MITESRPEQGNQEGPQGTVRYAVVGLGHIAQAAVLPAFKHAKSNSRLVALVSGSEEKRRVLGKKYRAKAYSYDEYDGLLRSGEIDAVYIALPNQLHCEYSVRAAEAGVHVLCEKPMALTEDECEQMIVAARDGGAKLMIAYRLHFEEANLRAIEVVQSGQIGEPRFFESAFAFQVRPGDIRVRFETGGGTLYDIGVYCINAARYLFRDEPTEAFAWYDRREGDARFSEIEEMTSAILRFPGNRLATFTCSFGAASLSSYRVCGTEGDLRLEPAYDYQTKRISYLTVGGQTHKQVFPKRDQFAPELEHFSKCILENRDPEPSGWEGLNDVRIVRALYRSANEGRPVKLHEMRPTSRPTPEQEAKLPPVHAPQLVNVQPPSTG